MVYRRNDFLKAFIVSKAKNHQALLHAPYYGVSVENTAINLTTI